MQKNNFHIIVMAVGFLVYTITVVVTLLLDQYICNIYSIVICMVTVAFVAISSFIFFILAIVNRTIKRGVHATYMALFALTLNYFTYLLATQCPGW
jgi:lipopolysaccharide export LptBFGC system permease protein LptF